MSEVYLNRTSIFFPNQPVSNNEMEDYLGQINGKPSKSRAIVLRNNGIENRYYALDKLGNATHTNAEMTANAVMTLFENNPGEIKEIELLTCGTATPDQLLPSHAVMVHGLLTESNSIETVSFSGSCCSGMHALKYAYLSVKSGEKQKAISTGSERISSILKADNFEEEAHHLEALNQNPYIAFEKDFLRWMLSDGAGAFLIENKKNTEGFSLKIEWIELLSFANQMEPCMFMGAEKLEDGSLKSYQQYSMQELAQKSVLSLKQDTKLLSANIVEKGFNSFKDILSRKGITVEEIDFLLPHVSSYFFQSKIYENLERNGNTIPYEKWFTNLKTKGNVGSCSIYLMVDELLKSDRLKIGNKILLVVPESARFSYAFCLLTVC
jgi:3-oxoacyl-[acyl-carrier-protein] synthase III